MKYAVITINYNQHRLTNELIASFAANAHLNDFYFIILDPSDKPPTESIKKILPNISILPIKNGGYSYGVNRGIEEALSKNIESFCIINNDTFVKSDFTSNLIYAFEKYDAFGGKIYYAPGYEYHKNRYQKKSLGQVLWYAGGIIDWSHVYTSHRGVDEVDQEQYDKAEKTQFITGCLFCLNKKVLDKVGFWNERYFLYYEDVDYSMRVKQKGFNLWYEPSLTIWHKNAQSTQGSGSDLHRKQQGLSRLRFGLTYAPWRTKLHLVKNYLLGGKQ